MTTADFYIRECEKIIKGKEGSVIVEFNSLMDVSVDLYYVDGGKSRHFTLKPRITHYSVRFNSAEGFRDFLRTNTSLFNRGFIVVAYVNKKPIITNPEKTEKTQIRRVK